MQTFLVEHYRPGAGVHELRRAAADVAAAARAEREVSPVRVLRTTIVPGDEGFLSLVEAASEDAVRELCARAGVLGRISAVVEADE